MTPVFLLTKKLLVAYIQSLLSAHHAPYLLLILDKETLSRITCLQRRGQQAVCCCVLLRRHIDV